MFATLRKEAGEKSFRTCASTVREVLDELTRRYGQKFGMEVENCSILVNGRNIIHLEGVGTLLKDGDVVSCFPPLAGG